MRTAAMWWQQIIVICTKWRWRRRWRRRSVVMELAILFVDAQIYYFYKIFVIENIFYSNSQNLWTHFFYRRNIMPAKFFAKNERKLKWIWSIGYFRWNDPNWMVNDLRPLLKINHLRWHRVHYMNRTIAIQQNLNWFAAIKRDWSWFKLKFIQKSGQWLEAIRTLGWLKSFA